MFVCRRDPAAWRPDVFDLGVRFVRGGRDGAHRGGERGCQSTGVVTLFALSACRACFSVAAIVRFACH